MQPRTLSPQLFTLLSSLVEEHAGLHYAPTDIGLFADKIALRLDEVGFANPLDYYYFLRYDPKGAAELNHLLDVLVVGETYLFREVDALAAAITHVVRPAIAARGHARIWSAGCSTGEEPFTLAMLLANSGLLKDTDIIATDISARSLTRARAGVVPVRSLRALDHQVVGAPAWIHPIAERWIERKEASTATTALAATIAPALLKVIDFQQGSILTMKSGSPFIDVDLILCRNVLIYFRDDVVRLAVEALASRLRVGGRLLVGTSESLLRFGTMLRCEEHGGAFFYTKTASQ